MRQAPRPWLVFLRAELWPLIGFAAACLLALIFLDFAEDLHEGETFAFDRAILLAFRGGIESGLPVGPSWLPQAVIEFSALGSVPVLTVITCGVTGFLVMLRKWRMALLLLAAVLGGALLTILLKDFIERARPDSMFHLVKV